MTIAKTSVHPTDHSRHYFRFAHTLAQSNVGGTPVAFDIPFRARLLGSDINPEALEHNEQGVIYAVNVSTLTATTILFESMFGTTVSHSLIIAGLISSNRSPDSGFPIFVGAIGDRIRITATSASGHVGVVYITGGFGQRMFD